MIQHDWDGDKCANCNQSKEEFEFYTEMMVLLRAGDDLNWDEIRARDGASPGYHVPEAIQAAHQVRQKIWDKHGQEGLDKMMSIVRAEGNDSLTQYVEDSWRLAST